LHGDEVLSIELVDLMDGADVRVVQGRGGPRFPLKALNRLAIARVFCRQKLQGDVAPEFDVLGFVHYTHATTAQFFQDAVVGYGLVDQVGLLRSQGVATLSLDESRADSTRKASRKCARVAAYQEVTDDITRSASPRPE